MAAVRSMHNWSLGCTIDVEWLLRMSRGVPEIIHNGLCWTGLGFRFRLEPQNG
jgi:hypothetical protein